MDPAPSPLIPLALLLLYSLLLLALQGCCNLSRYCLQYYPEQPENSQGRLATLLAQRERYLWAGRLGNAALSIALGWLLGSRLSTTLGSYLASQGPAASSWQGVLVGLLLAGLLYLYALGVLYWPRHWARRQATRLLPRLGWLLQGCYLLSWPLLRLAEHSATALQQLAGIVPGYRTARAQSEEQASLASQRVMASAAELGELEVLDWANSREDLVYLDSHAALHEVFELFRRHTYSRYPVWDEASGRFIGLLHIKDLLLQLSLLEMLPGKFDLASLLRPLERVHRHLPLASLLEQFRQGGTHFALVEEADGKAIGFLTMEDVLEVLVGDIQDEHRKVERGVLSYQPGKLLVRGDTPLFKLERLLGVDLDAIQADTLAGLLYASLERMPEEGEQFELAGLRISIKKMKGPKIVLAKVTLAA